MSRKPRTADSGRKTDINLEEGDNAKILKHTLEVSAIGTRINKNDPEEVRERINKYFEMCVENDMHPTVPELSLALGVNRKTIYQWINGGYGSDFNEISKGYISKAVDVINSLLEQYMMSGKTNIVGAIFIAKNNFGYKDQAETVVRHEIAVNKSAEQLIAESQLLIDTD